MPARLAAGIDIGGTKCLGLVLDRSGVIVREDRLSTPRGADALIDVLSELAERLEPYDSLGIGAAGLVTREGIWRAAPNVVGIADLPIGERLSDSLGHPVHVDNDATCATLAEWRHGAAVGASDVVLVTLGTGIGGGLVVNGRLVRGVNGFAGEPGHMVIDPTGPPCVCGRRGCWERFASGSGLARLAREAAAGGRLRRVVSLAAYDAEAVRGEHVQAAAREGDEEALAVVDEWAWWVALGLVNLSNLLDPQTILMGGGLASAADLVLGPVRRHFVELLYAPTHRPHPHIDMTRLGERSGAIGAALLADYAV
jgi:glucokinase